MEKLKNKIKIKQILQSLLIFLLFYYSSYFQLIPILIFNLDLDKISEATKIYLGMFSNVMVIGTLIFIYHKSLLLEWKKFKTKFLQNIDVGFRYWFLGLIGMAVSNVIITFLLKGGGATNEKIVQDMITTLPFIMLLNAGVLAPILEEFVFRKAFREVLSNKWAFILASGLVFGGLHVITSFQTPLELLYIIPYSSLGFSFAFMYDKTDTVFTSIAMHMIHNTVLTLLSIL